MRRAHAALRQSAALYLPDAKSTPGIKADVDQAGRDDDATVSVSIGPVRHCSPQSCQPSGTIAGMSNIASLLNSEISRVARKESRADILALKKIVAKQRSEIVVLKRCMQAVEQQMRRLSKITARARPTIEESEQPAQARRFSAKGLKSQRKRLGAVGQGVRASG